MTLTTPSSEIITFYSFKGGTGRSMALANLAILTARLSKKVLVLDWDLEAPGLHRYFSRSVPYPEDQLNNAKGLIDYFLTIKNKFDDTPYAGEQIGEEKIAALLRSTDLSEYVIETNLSGISLMKAGAFTEAYPRSISQFPWEAFFQRAPGFFRCLGEFLKERYDFIFIDSRTGFTDTSGICTMLMPEKIVLVFTPNRQSLDGVVNLARKALDYRMDSTDFRPLKIYPVPSRVELAEKDLREQWRRGLTSDVIENNILGYQPVFEQIFNEYYGTVNCDLTSYFDAIQIHHEPKYSYGEDLAVLKELYSDRLSLTKVYSDLLQKLLFESKIFTESEHIPPENKSKFSVYISSSEKENEFANLLKEQLEESGKFSVSISNWKEASTGEDPLKTIEDKILKSQVFLPVISKNYLNSKFGDFELFSFARNLKTNDINLAIPVYVDKPQDLKSSSSLLSNLTGINFDTTDGNIKELAQSITDSIEINKSLFNPQEFRQSR